MITIRTAPVKINTGEGSFRLTHDLQLEIFHRLNRFKVFPVLGDHRRADAAGAQRNENVVRQAERFLFDHFFLSRFSARAFFPPLDFGRQ